MLFGLCGKSRSGKDYVAKYLQGAFGFHHTTFAEHLKRILIDLFHMTPQQLEESNPKNTIDERYKLTPRQMMQRIGKVFRDIYPDIWIDQVLLYHKACQRDLTLRRVVGGVLVSDVRLLREYHAIREEGGYLFKIVRLNEDGSLYIGTDSETSSDATETELDFLEDESFDAVFTAKSGELSWLTQQAKQAVEAIYASK